MKRYIPELGQAVFGCPTSQYDCPEYIEAGLKHLNDELCRIMWNKNQKEYQSPFGNYANEYKNDTFEVRSYYWGDNEDKAVLPNFQCGDFEVRWYKYLGRGMSMNKSLDANEFFDIIDRCIKSVRREDVAINN